MNRPDARRGRTTKVFAVGGTGRIGRAVANLLSRNELVSEIIVGGRDLPLAERAAMEIGPKATAARVDFADEADLRSSVAGCDLIVNTAGPDVRAALPVTRAAIAAGIDCVDIAADGRTLEKVLALDAKAKEAGVSVVTGIGHIPGISNLLMQHAANQLDTVAGLRVCVWWDLSREKGLFGDPREMRKSGRINASWQTVLGWVAGKVQTYRDGHAVDVDPFDEATEIVLPQGEIITAIPIGSTEPITFPRRIPGLRSVAVLMALHPPQLHEPLREQAARLANGEMDSVAATLAFLEALTTNPAKWLESQTTVPSGFGMLASATGRRRGHEVRFSCWPSGPWESTAGPLTAAALRILQGDVKARGVLSPESAFDPIPFLREAARYASKPPTNGILLGESSEVLTS